MLMYASAVFNFYSTLGVYRLETNKLSTQGHIVAVFTKDLVVS